MVTLTWSSGNPLDRYDNPNCHWGSPSYRLEPGDPGYVPWTPPGPPAPKRATAERTLQPLFPIPNPTQNPMSPFRYIIVPNPKNPQRPFRARPERGEQVDDTELLPAIAADAGVTPEIAGKVITSLFKVILGFLRQGRAIGPVQKLFRAFPSITGSFATNDPSADEIKAGIGFTLAPTPEAEATMVADITVEKSGQEGTVTPEVASVTLSPGGLSNVYSTTAALKVSGDHFRGSGQSQLWAKAALVDAQMGNPIVLTVFSCSQTEMLLSPAPAGTTGIRYLRVEAGWDDTLFTVYSEPLTLAT